MLKDTVGPNNTYRSEGVTVFGGCPAREAGRQMKCTDNRRFGNPVTRLTKTWLKVLYRRKEKVGC